MNDRSRPAPRPRPRPQPEPPAAPAPPAAEWSQAQLHTASAQAGARAQEPAEVPDAAELPGAAELPAPAAVPTAAPRGRGGRRRADRHAARRQRNRRVSRAVAGLCVLAGAATFAVVAVRDQPSEAARRSATPSPTPSPTATGADLQDPDVALAFVGGAVSDVAAVTAYDYRSLDDALTAGLAVTTGRYRAAYRAALTGELAATARARHAVHTFEVLNAGIGEIDATGTEAKVLVFGRQQVTDDTTGGAADTTPVTLCVTVRRTGSRYLIADLVEGANAGLPPGGPELPAAAEAARSEVLALLTYRRADFDADLQRALAGASGTLRDEIQRNAAATRAALVRGRYDLTGTVTSIAVERAAGDAVTLLVAAQSGRVTDTGAATSPSPVRYEVTVTRSGGSWTAAAVTTVDGG